MARLSGVEIVRFGWQRLSGWVAEAVRGTEGGIEAELITTSLSLNLKTNEATFILHFKNTLH